MILKQTTIFHVDVTMVAKSQKVLEGMLKREGYAGSPS
jgi:hypothetical protein